MSVSLARLETLKKTLEEKRRKDLEARAEEKVLLKQLKEQYGCSSLEEAVEMIEVIEHETEERRTKNEERYQEVLSSMREHNLI